MVFRSKRSLLVSALFLAGLFYLWSSGARDAIIPSPDTQQGTHQQQPQQPTKWPVDESIWRDQDYFWRKVKINYPVGELQKFPTWTPPKTFPKIQANFPAESQAQRQKRVERQQAVKTTFLRCWTSYKKHAWMADELEPVSGGRKNPFGGWAATLVDSLDTLWIMDLRDEFAEAVAAVDDIDFTHTDLREINVFETTIRYLGGFLSAYEMSEDLRLLRKAAQVGEMIYKAFDTPNHMPITRWDLHAAIKGQKQDASSGTLVAEVGSLCMELTRLSQITGDDKWFDAAQRITDTFAAQQDSTELPGMWPLVVNTKDGVFNLGNSFTLGAMADSVYEYLPKMAAMTGGRLPVYQAMYEKAIDTASKYNFFRPMTPTNEDILISGPAKTIQGENGKKSVVNEHEGQHLVCFVGGMLAIGGRLFNRPKDVELAGKLTDGCVYTYKAFPHGVMPELFFMAACDSDTNCTWDEKRLKKEVVKANNKGVDSPDADADAIISDGHIPKGFTRIPDTRYILRPEAIESVMVLYRVTGRQDLVESAWDMFNAIEKVTATKLANTAVWEINDPSKMPSQSNSMESFWTGETLKYFYLTFSEPSLISLDEYVFNTEAHPLRVTR
jgi:mannosyl-oligosaccharide alpha-1,2-mannosidase